MNEIPFFRIKGLLLKFDPCFLLFLNKVLCKHTWVLFEKFPRPAIFLDLGNLVRVLFYIFLDLLAHGIEDIVSYGP